MDIEALWTMNDRIWYAIYSMERQSVILELTASADFGKQSKIQNKTKHNFIEF